MNNNEAEQLLIETFRLHAEPTNILLRELKSKKEKSW
jgi:hypothetical protein